MTLANSRLDYAGITVPFKAIIQLAILGCSQFLEKIDSILQQYLDPLVTERDHFLSNSDLVDCRPTVLPLIEKVYLNLTSILVKTADELIPKMGPTTLKHWWNEELDGLKQAAIESNNQWIVDGRPKQGLLAEIRKK